MVATVSGCAQPTIEDNIRASEIESQNRDIDIRYRAYRHALACDEHYQQRDCKNVIYECEQSRRVFNDEYDLTVEYENTFGFAEFDEAKDTLAHVHGLLALCYAKTGDIAKSKENLRLFSIHRPEEGAEMQQWLQQQPGFR